MTGAFGNRTFRRLFAGWTIGNVADSALFLTLAVWVKDLSGSSSAAALVFLALGLPVLITPLLGYLADRVRRRPLMVVANLVAAAAVLTLLAVSDRSDLWLIYAVTLVYGSLGHLNSAAQSGLLRDVLPDEQLATANAALSTVDQGLRIFTPLAGAAVYTVWGGGTLAVIVAACLVVTALVLILVEVRESPVEDVGSAPFWTEVSGGFTHILRTPLLARLVLVVAIAFGVVGVFNAALFEVVDRGLGREPAFFGVLMSVQGAGSIFGGVTAALVLRRLAAARATGTALAMIAAAGVLLSVGSLPLVLFAGFIAGIAIPWMLVAMMTTRQLLTPPRLQGRTAAAVSFALTVPQLASIAAGAALVSVVDYRAIVLVAAAVLAACAVSLFASRVQAPDPSQVRAESTAVAAAPHA